MYTNPEMFNRELELEKGNIDASSFQQGKFNSEFHQHSRSARMSGKPRVSKLMQKAINEFEQEKNMEVEPVMVYDGEVDNDTAESGIEEIENMSDELG